MDTKNAFGHTGVANIEQKSTSKTNLRRPIITPAEARKTLGRECKILSDDDLYRVIIEMERLALLLVGNPKIFDTINEGDSDEQK